MICKKTAVRKGCKSGRKNGIYEKTDFNYCYDVDYLPLDTLRDQVFGGKDGAIFPHQRRWGPAPLEDAYKRLKDAGFNDNGILSKQHSAVKFNNFEDLYDTVESIIKSIRGIGDLAIYDISVRIGNHQTPKILPSEYVYIHAGTRTGAEKALGRRINVKRLPIGTFSHIPYLNGMNALEIEDFLCIYKNVIPHSTSNGNSTKTKNHK